MTIKFLVLFANAAILVNFALMTLILIPIVWDHKFIDKQIE